MATLAEHPTVKRFQDQQRVGDSSTLRTGSIVVTQIEAQTNGSRPLRIPCAPRVPSITSPATPTTSSLTVSHIDPG
jgi:hypothetical protein